MAKTEKSQKAAASGKSKPGAGLPSWAPHAIVIGLMFLILAVYFGPLFSDKELRQGDIQQGRGMSKEIIDYREQGQEILWTSRMFGGMPTYQITMYNYGNLIEYLEYATKQVLPLPVAFILFLAVGFYFLLIVLRINPWIAGIAALGYGFSSYWFILLEAGHNSKLNAMAYLAPLIASMILTYRGRIWLGGALFVLFMALELNANHIQITYYFFVFFISLMVVSQFVTDLMKKNLKKFFMATGMLAVAGLLAAGPNLARLWPTFEYAKESIRGANELTDGKDPKEGLKIGYALQWSYGRAETFTLLVPEYMGGASYSNVGIGSQTHEVLKQHPQLGPAVDQDGTPYADLLVQSWPTYWGTQPGTSGPVYVGAVLLFLAVMGLVLVHPQFTWWIVLGTVVAVMLSWGRNLPGFTQFFYDYFPLYNRFRAPAMMLVIAQFAVPLLASFALYKLFQKKESVKQGHFLGALISGFVLTGGLCLIFATSADSIVPRNMPFDKAELDQLAGQIGFQQGWDPQTSGALVSALHVDRAAMLRSDAMRSLGFIAACALLIFIWYRGIVKQTLAIYGGLALLVIVDLYPVDRRYLNEDSFVTQEDLDRQFIPSAADQAILDNAKDINYRVVNVSGSTFQEATTSYHHKNVGGYHPAKLRRYNDVITRVLSPDSGQAYYRKGEVDRLRGMYFGMRQQLPDPKMKLPPEAIAPMQAAMRELPVLNMLNTKYIIFSRSEYMANPFCLGDAWFVKEVKKVNTPLEEIDALHSFDPSRTAIVGSDFAKAVEGFTAGPDSSATITLTTFEPMAITYNSNSKTEQLAVFSEVYYKYGWNAYIDEEKVDHFRVNYILRALRVPAGAHKIEFKFEPTSYKTGNMLALLTSLIALAAIGGGIYMDYRQRKAATVPEDQGEEM